MPKKWDALRVEKIYSLPIPLLLSKAIQVHAKHFNPCEIEFCSLLSIKTGACPEDCAYCPQSGHYNTGTEREKLWALQPVLEKAKIAKANGARRFCMGAAWRSPPKKEFPRVLDMIKAVKEIGLETCVTLGMLDDEQTQALKDAGLDFYNHNLDTSADHYKNIVTTRTYQERLDTLEKVHRAGMEVCCGGILGMGETRDDRIALLVQLANLTKPPKSVPINHLLPIPGTPLQDMPPLDNVEFIRTIATARIMMPSSFIRLSAGRGNMSLEMQTLCFLAGANSMWLGEKLLVTKNATGDQDKIMMKKLGLTMASMHES